VGNQYKLAWDWTTPATTRRAGSTFQFWDGIVLRSRQPGASHPGGAQTRRREVAAGSIGYRWLKPLSVPVDTCSRVDFWIAYYAPDGNMALFDPDSGAVWAMTSVWYGPGSS